MIRQKRYMRFPEGKAKALTLSYDDGVDEDFDLIQILKEHKMRATFNISTDWLAEEGTVYPKGEDHRRMSISQCKKCYDPIVAEVAIHGLTHPWMESFTSAMMMKQVISDREQLEAMFETVVKGMAYPYGVYNDTMKEVLKLAEIAYCRTVHSTYEFSLPQDWLEWNPTCHHDDERLMELADQFLELQPDREAAVFYLWGHSFEFERFDNWKVIKEFADKVSDKQDVWYATNGEIYDYRRAYERLEFSVDGTRIHNPSAMTVWLTLDEQMYSVKPGETVNI